MLNWLRQGAADKALEMLRDRVINPQLAGLARVESMRVKDGKLFLTLLLAGMEDRPVEVVSSGLELAADCSSIKAGKYSSNMPFAENALNRYAARPFAVPEGRARFALCAARGLLGL